MQYSAISYYLIDIIILIYLIDIASCTSFQIASCDSCQRQNHKLRKTNATLHSIPVKDEAWYQLGMDLVGLLPVTPAGNKYLITVADYYTKWAVAGGLKDKSASSVAEFLYMVGNILL